MTWEERVRAVQSLRFTERQAGFLVLVMLHAGVCLGRQYRTFAASRTGRRSTTSSATSSRAASRPRTRAATITPGSTTFITNRCIGPSANPTVATGGPPRCHGPSSA